MVESHAHPALSGGRDESGLSCDAIPVGQVRGSIKMLSCSYGEGRPLSVMCCRFTSHMK